MKTKGMFWHIHHDILVEWSDDIGERTQFIEQFKPKTQIKRRLELMKPVKGELPVRLVKVAREYCKTHWISPVAYFKILELCSRDIDALHKKECPKCPWNGVTIFPR